MSKMYVKNLYNKIERNKTYKLTLPPNNITSTLRKSKSIILRAKKLFINKLHLVLRREYMSSRGGTLKLKLIGID